MLTKAGNGPGKTLRFHVAFYSFLFAHSWHQQPLLLHVQSIHLCAITIYQVLGRQKGGDSIRTKMTSKCRVQNE